MSSMNEENTFFVYMTLTFIASPVLHLYNKHILVCTKRTSNSRCIVNLGKLVSEN